MIKIDEFKKLSNFKTLDFEMIKKVEQIYKIKKENNILIYCDVGEKRKTASARFGKTFYEYFKKKGNDVSLVVGKNLETVAFAPKRINDAVFSLTKDDILVLVGSGMTLYFHKNKKRVDKLELIGELGFKMVSTNGLLALKNDKIKTFAKAFNHDQKELIKLNKKLVALFKKSKFAKVTCSFGTNLEVKLGNRKIISNDGSLKDFSTNYPVGEVYTSPLENGTSGIAYIKSAKVLGDTKLFKKPKKMILKAGVMADTNIPNLKKGIDKLILFNKKKGVKNYKTLPKTIAEFAIGTNKKAKLIGLMINDEKAYGTVHFALGANSHFGGKTYCNGHMDYVIENPTLYLDNKLVLKNGKFLI